MKLIRFIGTGDGVVDNANVLHMDGAVGSDFTLCGITLDGDEATAGEFQYVFANAVTCPECVLIIKHCQGVRTKMCNEK